jgi:hypothetical protein
MKPESRRNEARYCATRFSITCQPAMTTSTVVALFSRMSRSEMPSMPR